MKHNEIEGLKVLLASQEDVEKWSHGEVKRAETYSYRTYSPEPDGLFCEKIFGPVRNYQCHCGKLKGIQYKGLTCPRCGVEVLPSSVRRERFGIIKLASPVVHIWYFKNNINYVGLLLGLQAKAIEKVVYFVSYIVIDPKQTKLRMKQLLTDEEYRIYKEEGYDFVAKKGGGAIKDLLKMVDLEKIRESAVEKIKNGTKQEKIYAVRLLGVVEGLIQNNRRPEDIVLDVVPVIPPDLRPLVPLEGGKYASDDLNELYRRVINRNNRLKRLIEVNAPDIMLQNERRMLQESVDALFDNGRRTYPVLNSSKRPLRSLTDILKGKEGRFRENLLGKRVDYSGRAVIVIGPDLNLDQCGVPKEMALELFKPFIIYELSKLGYNKRRAKELLENPTPEVWKALEDISKNYVVLLNRAPTLHRLSIQAFKPILTEGKAIQLSPLVCTPFNADFDGDQMAIHLPISFEAQTEARLLLLSSHNILSPANSSPINGPVQDMVLGLYYLTFGSKSKKGYSHLLDNPVEVELLYERKKLGLHDAIKYFIDGEKIETTVGRVLFNDKIMENIFSDDEKTKRFKFINETVGKQQLDKIISDFYSEFGLVKTGIFLDNLKDLGFKYSSYAGISIGMDDVKIPPKRKELIENGTIRTNKINNEYNQGLLSESERYRKIIDVWLEVADNVKTAVFSYFAPFDSLYMMANSGARGNKDQITQMAGIRGLMAGPTGKIIEFPIKSNLREGLTVLEYFLSTHGARKGQADTALKTANSGYLTRRLVDVTHGLIVKEKDCALQVIEPIRIGDEIVESLSERAAGKIAAEDVKNPHTHDIFIHKGDMLNHDQAELLDKFNIQKILVENYINGVVVTPILEGDSIVVSLEEQIWGRYAAEDVIAPQKIREISVNSDDVVNAVVSESIIDKDTGEIFVQAGDIINKTMLNKMKKHRIKKVKVFVGKPRVIVKRNELIDKQKIEEIEKFEITKIKIRSPITCHSDHGVCEKCYGLDLSSRKMVNIGEAVGVVAAESIGEPGTQLTLRTFHAGGAAVADITTGLPRIEELFSARSPRGKALIVPLTGTVEIKEDKAKKTITITNEKNEKAKLVTAGDKKLNINTGDIVKVGDVLSKGPFDPREILEIKGIIPAARYLIQEIEKVYKSQGVDINVKHVELVVKQMFNRVKIVSAGDTNYYPGEIVTIDSVLTANRIAKSRGRNIACFKFLIQGITKAALSSDSFLSAASFQETPRVLAEAAIKGKVDLLRGMKESIIVGKKIPAGTNFRFEE